MRCACVRLHCDDEPVPLSGSTILTTQPTPVMSSFPHHRVQVMRNPVCTVDGHTFEREAIEQWLISHDTSPLTGLRYLSSSPLPRRTAESFFFHSSLTPSCPGSRCTCLPCRDPNATSESSKMHLHIPTSDHIEFCESQYDCLLHQIWGMLTLSVSASCYAGDFDLSLLSSALTMPMCGTTSSDLTTASH